jgi:hypothetical protein
VGTWSLITAGGTTVDLATYNVRAHPAQGGGAVPRRLITLAGIYQESTADPRILRLTLTSNERHARLPALRRALLRLLDAGDTLTVRYAGAVRTLELAVVYWRGLEDTPPQGSEITLDLVAYPPGLWVDTEVVTQALTVQTEITGANYVLERSAAGVWSALGSGPGAAVNCLVYGPDGNLYAGIDASPGVKVWNGSTWATYQGGVNGAVHALLWTGDRLYVGGNFTQAGGSLACANIAFYESGWDAMSGGLAGGTVYTLFARASGSSFYVYAGGTVTSYLGRWSVYASVWSASYNLNGAVYAGVASDTGIFVAGAFTTLAGTAVSRIAFRPNDQSTVALGSGVDGTVDRLVLLPTGLLVGGGFQEMSGSQLIGNLFAWTGNAYRYLAEDGFRPLVADETGRVYVAAPGDELVYTWAGANFIMLDVTFPSSSSLPAVALAADGRRALGFDRTGTATVGGQTTVTNPGLACPCRVTLTKNSSTAYASLRALANLTTDTWFHPYQPVSPSDTVILDTAAASFSSALRGDLLRFALPESRFFDLVSGDNQLLVSFSPFFPSIAFTAEVSFYPRYASWEFGDGD